MNNKSKVFLSVLFALIVIVAIILCFLITYKDSNVTKSNANSNKNNTSNNTKPSNNNNTPNNNNNNNSNTEKPETPNNPPTVNPIPEVPQTNLDNNAVKKIIDYKLMALGYDYQDIKFDSNNLSQAMLEPYYAYTDKSKASSKTEIDNYFKAVYGNTFSKYANFICINDNEPLLIYDEKKQQYYFNEDHPGHGGRIYNILDYKVISSKFENNNYIISMAFLWGSNAEGFYVNNKELQVDFSESYEAPEDYEKAYINYFKNTMKDFSQYEKYTYTFKVVDNDVYLTSFKKTK